MEYTNCSKLPSGGKMRYLFIIYSILICCTEPIDTEINYDTDLCNFQTDCRSVTMFSPGPSIGDCDPSCSYAIQAFMECEEDASCEHVCQAENDAVIEVCPGWNFYRQD